jgi:hypothetical protein
MSRNIFGILAALIVTTGAAPAAPGSADVPLDQRIASAQVKLEQLGKLAAPGERTSGTESSGEGVRLAQHWHDHHWNNWRNWNNWNNHHWGNHHH